MKEKIKSFVGKPIGFVAGKFKRKKNNSELEHKNVEEQKINESSYFDNLEQLLVEQGITKYNIQRIKQQIIMGFNVQYQNIESLEKRNKEINEALKTFNKKICPKIKELTKSNSIKSIDNKNIFLLNIFSAIAENIGNRTEMDYDDIFTFASFLLNNYKESNIIQMSEAIKLYILCPNRNNLSEFLESNLEIKKIPKIIEGYNYIIKASYKQNNNSIIPERHYLEFIKILFNAGKKEKVEDFIEKLKVVVEYDPNWYVQFIDNSFLTFGQYTKEIEKLKKSIDNALVNFEDIYNSIPKEIEKEKENPEQSIKLPLPIQTVGLAVLASICLATGFRVGNVQQTTTITNIQEKNNDEEYDENEEGLDVYIPCETTAEIVAGGNQIGVEEKVFVRISSSGRVKEILYNGGNQLKSITTNLGENSKYLSIYGYEYKNLYEQNNSNVVRPNLFRVKTSYESENGTTYKSDDYVFGSVIYNEQGKNLLVADTGEEIPFIYLEDLASRGEIDFAVDRFVGDEYRTIAQTDIYVTGIDTDIPQAKIQAGTEFKISISNGLVIALDDGNNILGAINPWAIPEDINRIYRVTYDEITKSIDTEIPYETYTYYKGNIITKDVSITDMEKVVSLAYTSSLTIPNTLTSNTELILIDIDLNDDMDYNLEKLKEVAIYTNSPVLVRTKPCKKTQKLEEFLTAINSSTTLNKVITGVELQKTTDNEDFYESGSKKYNQGIARLKRAMKAIEEAGFKCVYESKPDDGLDITGVVKPGNISIRVVMDNTDDGQIPETVVEYAKELQNDGYNVTGYVNPTEGLVAASGKEINQAYKKLTEKQYIPSSMQVDVQNDSSDDNINIYNSEDVELEY